VPSVAPDSTAALFSFSTFLFVDAASLGYRCGPMQEPVEPSVADPAVLESRVDAIVDRLSFTGEGAEYFRIWIVNIALTVLTLGLYSAWAKVRRLQYFYRNTRLSGASFDYHGEPLAILKGRIVGAVLFGFYSFAGFVSPLFAVAVAALIATVMPWMISRSLRFRLHNSSYRGLRFRFSGSTRSAYWIFLGLPVLTLLSLFTAAPFWHQRLKRYQHANASYGQTRFTFDAPVGPFYVTYLGAAGIAFVAMTVIAGAAIALAGLAAMAVAVSRQPGTEPGTDAASTIVAIAFVTVFAVIYVLTVLTIQSFVSSRIRNLVWEHTRLGSHRFGSDVQIRTLTWIVLTNLLGTLGTLGLFWPFAQVRLARYLTSTLWIERIGAMDDFTAAATADVDAVGEEVAEFFDFDIAF
jgi:uncharacterized membrane protein YjgN (DUF898 family)